MNEALFTIILGLMYGAGAGSFYCKSKWSSAENTFIRLFLTICWPIGIGLRLGEFAAMDWTQRSWMKGSE